MQAMMRTFKRPERNPLSVGSGAMMAWREDEIANHVPNCGGGLFSKKPYEAG